ARQEARDRCEATARARRDRPLARSSDLRLFPIPGVGLSWDGGVDGLLRRAGALDRFLLLAPAHAGRRSVPGSAPRRRVPASPVRSHRREGPDGTPLAAP